jgi:hypothetical protein
VGRKYIKVCKFLQINNAIRYISPRFNLIGPLQNSAQKKPVGILFKTALNLSLAGHVRAIACIYYYIAIVLHLCTFWRGSLALKTTPTVVVAVVVVAVFPGVATVGPVVAGLARVLQGVVSLDPRAGVREVVTR